MFASDHHPNTPLFYLCLDANVPSGYGWREEEEEEERREPTKDEKEKTNRDSNLKLDHRKHNPVLASLPMLPKDNALIVYHTAFDKKGRVE